MLLIDKNLPLSKAHLWINKEFRPLVQILLSLHFIILHGPSHLASGYYLLLSTLPWGYAKHFEFLHMAMSKILLQHGFLYLHLAWPKETLGKRYFIPHVSPVGLDSQAQKVPTKRGGEQGQFGYLSLTPSLRSQTICSIFSLITAVTLCAPRLPGSQDNLG